MKEQRTLIERKGQRYLDEPRYREVSRADLVALSVNAAYSPVSKDFARAASRLARLVESGAPLEVLRDPVEALMAAKARMPHVPRVRGVIEEISHYERVRLKWVKPPASAIPGNSKA